MYTVKTKILLFALLGIISGFVGWISVNFQPDTLFMYFYYFPIISFGIFLYIAGKIVYIYPGRDLLNFIVLTISCIDGRYLSGQINEYIVSDIIFAFIVSLGLLFIWKNRSNILIFIMIVIVSSVLADLTYIITIDLIHLKGKWLDLIVYAEYQCILFSGIAFAYHHCSSNIPKQEGIKFTFLVLGIFPVFGVFLPFTSNVSPYEAIKIGIEIVMDFDFTHSDGIFSLLGVPFLLSLVILFWKLRSALSASVNTIEIYGGFILAITGFLATASFIIFIMIADSLNSFEIWVISTVSLLIMASIIFSFVNIRKNVPHLSKVHLALLSAYIPNAVLCLGLFFKDWQLGAKFAAFAVILYLTEIVVITINEWRSNKQYAQSGSYDVFSSLRVDRM